ncbi:MAG TPA: hypothetical protein VGR70_12100, partial [Stellaceae bacterium]|nr:hypothetical protein [Stellaceae bacterium]
MAAAAPGCPNLTRVQSGGNISQGRYCRRADLPHHRQGYLHQVDFTSYRPPCERYDGLNKGQQPTFSGCLFDDAFAPPIAAVYRG